jgi:hypothetical protein
MIIVNSYWIITNVSETTALYEYCSEPYCSSMRLLPLTSVFYTCVKLKPRELKHCPESTIIDIDHEFRQSIKSWQLIDTLDQN